VHRSRGHPLLTALLLVGACSLAGCAGSAGAGGGESTGPTVIGLDTMRYNPDTITVKAGQPTMLTFRNGGFIPHDLITEGGDQNANLANVGPGQTATGTFLASKPGTYQFVCVQPGHKESGMVGKIVVTE
jgi:plastocyanin